MSGEQQLERSVLESKERSELQEIAIARGLKSVARIKKSDLIDKILQTTGVQLPIVETSSAAPSGAVAKTSRPRRKRPEQLETPDSTSESSQESSASEPSSSATPKTSPRRTNRRSSGRASSSSSSGESSDSVSPNPQTPTQAIEPSLATQSQTPNNSNGSSNSSATSTDSAISSNNGTTNNNHGSAKSGDSVKNGDKSERLSPERSSQQRSHDGETSATTRRNRRRRGRDRADKDNSQTNQNEPQFQGEPTEVRGLLDLREEGFGFLRTNGYLPSSNDVYVSISQVRRFSLRRGDYIQGASRPAATSEKYPALLHIDQVSGLNPEETRNRPRFEDLTPLFPDERFPLELQGDPSNLTARIVDLLSPIGKGQRGLIVSPPKAGKTTIMKQIAHSIEENNPNAYLMVLLVDERPEEVTDMKRSVKGEVIASTFDRPAIEHTAVAELALDHAKRLVELGKDVIIILDGITRLARAYNLAAPASGRILSGGVDSAALYPPKKFFGAARNVEEGGSLTILATALVETGSRMDEVIFEEFKGTGNMELRLDRKLAERRIYPAIDVNASSTRHEELLFDRSQLQQVWKLRRVLNALGNESSSAAGLELLIDKIKTTKSNNEFLAEIAKGQNP